MALLPGLLGWHRDGPVRPSLHDDPLPDGCQVPTRVMAMGELYRWKESRDVPDTLNAILEYPEGFTVSLSSTFNNEFSQQAGFQILGTEGTLVLGGEGAAFYPEALVSDNRWIVESWPKALEDAYYRDPKVIA